ncbi:MAG: ABC transporter substrate-binding protein [Planctomycetes bacterium]|nr:ABC transporter substrate-binding protein [Planctomycetota bacterium]
MQRLATSLPQLVTLAASILVLPGSAPAQDDVQPPIRVALRARAGSADRITPLRYLGGFETKTLIYETLVGRGPDGRLEPALAHWRIDDGGRTFHFELRPDATFQDGTPVTAEAVRTHFRRWVGLPEHDWLLANRHIESIDVESERAFSIRLDQPYPLLADLAAVNPCSIVGPGARDWEGEFQRPMGSGPFHFVGAQDDGSWSLGRETDGPLVEVHPYPRDTFAPERDVEALDALARGDLEVFVSGWDEDLPAARLDELEQDPDFVVQQVPGSSVVYLSFRMLDGPTADLDVRRRIAAAIDRDALIQEVEGGRADPCLTWAAPAVEIWPDPPTILRPAPPLGGPRIPLRIAAGRLTGRAHRTADAVADQLRAHGFDVEVVSFEAHADLDDPGEVGTIRPLTTESGEVRSAANREVRRIAETADLCVEITHGLPYDPQLTLVARWGPFENHNEDEPRPESRVDPVLRELVEQTLRIPDENDCLPVYAQIQERMDEQVLIVPLYAPHRIAVHSTQVEGIGLGPDIYRVDLTDLHWVDVTP